MLSATLATQQGKLDSPNAGMRPAGRQGRLGKQRQQIHLLLAEAYYNEPRLFPGSFNYPAFHDE